MGTVGSRGPGCPGASCFRGNALCGVGGTFAGIHDAVEEQNDCIGCYGGAVGMLITKA